MDFGSVTKCSTFSYSNAAREMVERGEMCASGDDGKLALVVSTHDGLSRVIPGQTVTPAEHTRRILLAAREGGVTFERAWEQAMAAIPLDVPGRGDWLVALEATRGAWNVAYSRERLPVGAQAVAELAEGPDLAIRQVPDRANAVTRIATLD